MPERKKVSYNQLEPGYEFPPSSHRLDSSMVNAYLKAVEETNALYQDTGVVPPLAASALALTALSEKIPFPSGAIHVSQEFEFMDSVNTDDTLTSRAKVIKNQKRGRLHILTTAFSVFNQKQKEVLVGKTSFVLPEQA